MKSITLFFLIKSAISKLDLESYSINLFKNWLKKEHLFDIIQSIKGAYGEDVAIISCEELCTNHGGNCEKLVKDYIYVPESPSRVSNSIVPTIQKILSKKYPLEKEAKLKADKIKAKAKKKGINLE